MHVLVTGGAGFIGSHLVDRLIANQHHVTVLDDLSTGRRDNVAHHVGKSGFRAVYLSVLESNIVEELVKEADVVLHLAAAVGVKYILEKPLHSMRVNVRGTENVLEAADRHGTKVVLFSTSEIYGKSMDVPFREDHDRLLGPTTIARWSYSTSKAVDEILGIGYFEERDLPVTVVRIFNTCGPRQRGRYGMVVPRFVHQAIENGPITVYGDGTQTRCFCSVFDVVDGIMALLDAPRAIGEIFNLGSNEEVSILGLAERVRALAGSSSEIRFVPYEEAYEAGFEDMPRRVPDLTKIREYVGYRPRRTLDDILHSVIEYRRAMAYRPS
ncbi:MAG: NAD-dependent epimerase/dehydratase family protein [bacterium]